MIGTSVVDFETDKINRRPAYPPKPVGVAIRWDSGHKEYLAWGHPTGNNCDIATARHKLRDAYRAKRVIFHHSAFDIDVGECYFGLKPQGRVEDTLFLAFLKDPHAKELGLKPQAEAHLGMPPTEQDELRAWIIANIKLPRKTLEKDWAEYIALAPGDLVGRYAKGDVSRTKKLFDKFMPEIERRGMRDAYERELKCAPISLEMERSGIKVSRPRLVECRDKLIEMDRAVLRAVCRKLRLDPKKMKTEDNPKGFNLNSGPQLASALQRAGKLSAVVKTAKGNIRTSHDVLKATINDKELLKLLGVHSVADTYLTTFVGPWLTQSALTHGYLMPKFNQVRGYDQGAGGARTGRFSSSEPNLQNVAANFEESKNSKVLLYMQQLLRDDYDYDFIGLRDFFEPDEGKIIIATDYDQQELRLLAHFVKGVIMEEYIKNPRLDMHDLIRSLLYRVHGLDYFRDANKKKARKAVKTIVFGIIYGMGVDKLAQALGLEKNKARDTREAIYDLIPGIQKMMSHLQDLADDDKPMRTLMGREYYCEPPKFIEKYNRRMSFEYKLFNYRIQGSAADMTKQAMIDVSEEVPEVRIAIQVHDELLCMAPSMKYGPRIARAMCRTKLRVPLSATSKYSRKSWARVKEAA